MRQAIVLPDSLYVATELEQAGQEWIGCAETARDHQESYSDYLSAATTLEEAGQEYHTFNDTSQSTRALVEAEEAANHALSLAKNGHGSVSDASDKLSAIRTDRNDFGE
ncbi:MAG TPA: hypothetical protein VN934_05740 [Candidatus Tumulicola sp.]|nr:hypothetical protein [Candidatus Tumulicola sp.]